ncbi:hypothetical protein IAU59_000877 [Kwoniella sp. CBS 9459]
MPPDRKLTRLNQPSGKYHPFYQDPNDKVTLTSSDGVIFRASRYRLRCERRFEVDESSLDGHLAEIHLDFNETAVSLFLDTLNTRLLPNIDFRLDHSTILQLLDFGELYECDKVIQYARKILSRKIDIDPLEILLIASKRDDVSLAKGAIKEVKWTNIDEMRTTIKGDLEKVFSDYIKKLRPSFQLAIFHAALRCATSKKDSQRPWHGLVSWEDRSQTAANFDPILW